jgi:hypothetical protein
LSTCGGSSIAKFLFRAMVVDSYDALVRGRVSRTA